MNNCCFCYSQFLLSNFWHQFHQYLSRYSNPILFVAKILLLFRQQATGNRQQATGKNFNFCIYFLIYRNLCADCYSILSQRKSKVFLPWPGQYVEIGNIAILNDIRESMINTTIRYPKQQYFSMTPHLSSKSFRISMITAEIDDSILLQIQFLNTP